MMSKRSTVTMLLALTMINQANASKRNFNTELNTDNSETRPPNRTTKAMLAEAMRKKRQRTQSFNARTSNYSETSQPQMQILPVELPTHVSPSVGQPIPYTHTDFPTHMQGMSGYTPHPQLLYRNPFSHYDPITPLTLHDSVTLQHSPRSYPSTTSSIPSDFFCYSGIPSVSATTPYAVPFEQIDQRYPKETVLNITKLLPVANPHSHLFFNLMPEAYTLDDMMNHITSAVESLYSTVFNPMGPEYIKFLQSTQQYTHHSGSHTFEPADIRIARHDKIFKKFGAVEGFEKIHQALCTWMRDSRILPTKRYVILKVLTSYTHYAKFLSLDQLASLRLMEIEYLSNPIYTLGNLAGKQPSAEILDGSRKISINPYNFLMLEQTPFQNLRLLASSFRNLTPSEFKTYNEPPSTHAERFRAALWNGSDMEKAVAFHFRAHQRLTILMENPFRNPISLEVIRSDLESATHTLESLRESTPELDVLKNHLLDQIRMDAIVLSAIVS